MKKKVLKKKESKSYEKAEEAREIKRGHKGDVAEDKKEGEVEKEDKASPTMKIVLKFRKKRGIKD